MKNLLFILFLFIGTSISAQKAEYCQNLEDLLQEQFPGTEVTYNDNCMIITYPLALIANAAGYNVYKMREISLDQKQMNLFAKVYINKLNDSRDIFNTKGFYYIKLRFRDDHRHNYKIYSAYMFKLKYYQL